MFVVFKTYVPVMAIPMEYFIVMCLNLGYWCTLTLQTVFKGILQLFRVNMKFLIL
jgi:hypothetical protein